MKRYEIEIVLAIIIGLLLISVIFFNHMILGIGSFIYAQFLPYNVVFDPSVDLSKIDASQILTCLHGGGCPAGVTYINDETGLKEEREVIPNQQQPVQDFSPESQGIPIPSAENTQKANSIIYVIYGLIVISLSGIIGYLGFRWFKSK